MGGADRPGATGEFPDGKLNRTDEGELTIGIDVDIHRNIRLDFGKPVAWLAMSPDAAISFAELITRIAVTVKATTSNEAGKGH